MTRDEIVQKATFAYEDAQGPLSVEDRMRIALNAVRWLESDMGQLAELRRTLYQRNRQIADLECQLAKRREAAWQPIETYTKDSTLVLLLIAAEDDRENPLEDTATASITIGFNNLENDGEDKWNFAGWCWEHDHFTEGEGRPVAWMPLTEIRALTTGELKE